MGQPHERMERIERETIIPANPDTQQSHREARIQYLMRLPRHETDSIKQLATIMKQVGDIAGGFVDDDRHNNENSMYHDQLYKKHAWTGVCDLLAQLIIMCEVEGWDFEEATIFGVERAIEKITRHILHGE